jgi:hypothetical protein
MIWRPARRRALVDAALAAYAQWREECEAVRTAYRTWTAARACAGNIAFDAYQAALDREESAARTYARRMRRAGHLAETALAHQLQGSFPPR